MTRYAAWAASATLFLALAGLPAYAADDNCACGSNSNAGQCSSKKGCAKCSGQANSQKCSGTNCSACQGGSECCVGCGSSCCQNNSKVAQSTCASAFASCPICQIAAQLGAFGTCPMPTVLIGAATLDLENQVDELRTAVRELQDSIDEIAAPVMASRHLFFTMPGASNVAHLALPGGDPFCFGPGPWCGPMPGSMPAQMTCTADGKCTKASDGSMPSPAPMMQAAFAVMTPQGPMATGMQPMGGCACCTMKAVEESGHHKIAIQCGGDCWATCDSLVLNCGTDCHIKLAASGKQIALSGGCVHATADRVVRMTRDNCIALEGHVHLAYHKQSEKAEVTCDRVAINLADGRLEIGSSPMPSELKVVGWQLPMPMTVPTGFSR